MRRTCRDLDQNSGDFWLWSSPKVGEDLFFLKITCFWTEKPFHSFFFLEITFDRKTASIYFKTNENLGQVRLRLHHTSKTAPLPPLCEILATRLNQGCGSGSRKRKRQIFVKAEAASVKWVPLPLLLYFGHSYRT